MLLTTDVQEGATSWRVNAGGQVDYLSLSADAQRRLQVYIQANPGAESDWADVDFISGYLVSNPGQSLWLAGWVVEAALRRDLPVSASSLPVSEIPSATAPETNEATATVVPPDDASGLALPSTIDLWEPGPGEVPAPSVGSAQLSEPAPVQLRQAARVASTNLAVLAVAIALVAALGLSE